MADDAEVLLVLSAQEQKPAQRGEAEVDVPQDQRCLPKFGPEPLGDRSGDFRAEQMGAIRRRLRQELSSSKDVPLVRPKLAWLARYFDQVLEATPVSGVDPIRSPALERR